MIPNLHYLADYIHRQLPGTLTAITQADIPIYRERFATYRHPYTYAHSWTYILQACRGLLYRYLSDGLLLSLGWHNGHFVLVRPLGLSDRTHDEFNAVVALLHQVSGRPVYAKKLFSHELPYFTQTQGWLPSQLYPWNQSAHADDDTFPETILDLELTLNQRQKKLMKQIKILEQQNHIVQLIGYAPEMNVLCRRFLEGYFSDHPHYAEAYDNMLNKPVPDGAMFQIARIDHQIVGMTYLEALEPGTFGMYAAVFSRAYSGLSEYLYYRIWGELRKLGTQYLTLGGSELDGLHHFKLKFAPVEERQMFMRVYKPMTPEEREAALDQLVAEAQEHNMGYD